MTRQSNHAVHALLALQAARLPEERQRKAAKASEFAAGEKYGEAVGFRKGMACAALLACAAFVTGLVLAPVLIPLVTWWLP